MSHDHDASRTTYDRFVEFERLMHGYSVGPIKRMNPTPLGFCAFALTLFVYSFFMAGATVPLQTAQAGAMGLAIFYGGLIQLIAGILEFRIGNNFYGLMFCSYAGYWFGLASLYVVGSFTFFGAAPALGVTPNYLTVTDASIQSKALGVFYLGWTIFTLAMLISSVRSNAALIVFFFFLLATYALWTASYFLVFDQNTARAGGAIGIFTAVVGWFIGFASFLKRGDNSYFELPLYSLAPKTAGVALNRGPVELH